MNNGAIASIEESLSTGEAIEINLGAGGIT